MPNGNQPQGFDPDLAAQLERQPATPATGGFDPDLASQLETTPQEEGGFFDFLTTPIEPLQRFAEAAGEAARNIPSSMPGLGFASMLSPEARGAVTEIAVPTSPLELGMEALGTGMVGRGLRAGRRAIGAATDAAETLRLPRQRSRFGKVTLQEPAIQRQPRPQALGEPRLIKPTGKFFRELNPEQQGRLLERRERWFADLAKGGVTDPPMSLVHAMDQLGTRYEQAQDATLALKGLAKGTLEGKDFQQWNQIARNLGKQLSRAKGLARAGKVTSAENLAKSTAKALDEAGAISAELMAKVGLAATGAVAGGAAGETPEEQLKLAALGALGGAVTPRALRAVRSLKAPKFDDLVFFNMLSSPSAMAKANAGALGGTIVKATELIGEGAARMDMRPIVQGMKILKRLTTHGPRVYAQVLKNPERAAELIGDVGRIGQKPGTGLTGRTVGRVFNAGDAAAIDAMKAGGISIDEARTITLAGRPTSKVGQRTLSAIQQLPGQALIAPFPRVGIQSIERGLERIPGLNVIPGAIAARTPGAPLLRQAGQIAKGAGRGLIDPGNIARGATGTGAFLAGQELEGEIPPALVPFIAALAGPAVLPFTLGVGTSLAQRSGRSPVGATVEAAGENVPLGGALTQPFFDPAQIIRRMVPGAAGAVARGMDPAFGRETGRETLRKEGFGEIPASLGPAMAQIPGLREQLPEQFTPVTAFGERRMPEQTPVGRALAPTPRQFQEPVADVTDPNVIAAQELGINLSAPSGTFAVKGFDVPVDRETRLQLQQARGQAKLQAIQLISQRLPGLLTIPNSPLKSKMVSQLVNRLTDELLGQQEAGIVAREQPEAVRQLPQTIREPTR